MGTDLLFKRNQLSQHFLFFRPALRDHLLLFRKHLSPQETFHRASVAAFSCRHYRIAEDKPIRADLLRR